VDVRLKRVYEPADETDGYRVLVDRLWPRGVPRERARLDEWERELAPSAGLRTWFGHDPDRFEDFRRRYIDELRRQRPRIAEEVGEKNPLPAGPCRRWCADLDVALAAGALESSGTQCLAVDPHDPRRRRRRVPRRLPRPLRSGGRLMTAPRPRLVQGPAGHLPVGIDAHREGS
jgi:uncharacterized protein YeaO (DUF488 family)